MNLQQKFQFLVKNLNSKLLKMIKAHKYLLIKLFKKIKKVNSSIE